MYVRRRFGLFSRSSHSPNIRRNWVVKNGLSVKGFPFSEKKFSEAAGIGTVSENNEVTGFRGSFDDLNLPANGAPVLFTFLFCSGLLALVASVLGILVFPVTNRSHRNSQLPIFGYFCFCFGENEGNKYVGDRVSSDCDSQRDTVSY